MSLRSNDGCSLAGELIETLWNVNSAAALIVELRSRGINRNIVECK